MTTKTLNKSRRRFMQSSAAVSGGLTIGVALPITSKFAEAAEAAKPTELNAWVVVRPDDTVLIRYARSEMGQGASTAAPMIVAEELECDWRKVKMEYASANEHVRRNRVWGSMASVGSFTIRTSQEYLRKAGAGAREMLVQAAATRWNVPAGECTAKLGVITHGPTNRRVRYGQVATDAAKLEVPKDPKLKDPKDWTIIGKPMKRFDIPDTVMGRQRYAIDTQLPGMLYASANQCPVFGGKVKSFDESKIAGRRGVLKVVNMGDAIAVVADNWWRANEALKALPVEWDLGPNAKVSSDDIKKFLADGLALPDLPVAEKKGDFNGAIGSAAKVLEAEYYTPFLAHVTMEPQNATVLIKDGRVEVWTATQNAEGTLAAASAVAGVPLENVDVHRIQLGGGFGRRSGGRDYVRQAVLLAKEFPGKPVKLVWTRDEDTQHDFYRPVALYRMRAGMDAEGNVTAFQCKYAVPSLIARTLNLPLKDGIDAPSAEGWRHFPYGVANTNMEYAQRNPHVPIGFWRSVGWSQNSHAREGFIDELAHAAGKDPYEFRRALLKDSPKPLAVLDAAAKAANWGAPLPAGVFRGIATTEPYGSFTAAVVEASCSDKGELVIHRIVSAVDCGYAVNPDSVDAQTKGSAVYGLSAVLYGEITIKDGRVEQSNFHDVPSMRIHEMPKIETVIASTGGFWGGIGEPTLAPMGPALVNAIFAATGRRIRSLPLSNHGIKLTGVKI